MKLGDILDVLRNAYCRTIGIEYMHIQEPGAEALDPGAGRGRDTTLLAPTSSATSSAGSTPPRRSRSSSAPSTSARSASGIEGAESRHPDPRRHPRAGRRRRARRRRHGHGPPRPPQRPGQHRRQELRPALQGVRGLHRPRVHPGLRRREVPPRPDRHLHEPRTATTITVELAANPSHLETVDPVVVGMARAKQDLHQRPRGLLGAAGAGARRRRLRRPGRRGRDAELLDHQGLPGGRHHPPDHQQPARASPPRRTRPARRSTAPTWPRWSRRRSST